MAGVRFTELQSRPMEFLDFTSVTLDEFQQLVPPFETAFQCHMAVWRMDGKPRTARRFTVYKNCPLPTPEDRLLFEPHPALVYGQVVKKKRQGRLQELVSRVCCGPQRLQTLGLSISPSVLDRLNLPLRHALAPLVRTSQSFWQDRTQMRRRVVVLQAFYHCARPPRSLRLPLPEQASHASGLMPPKGCHRIPAMAAGLTDHVWTFRALLTAKFEPIHNQSDSG
jgi:hypothetical protein